MIHLGKIIINSTVAILLGMGAVAAYASDVNITQDIASVSLHIGNDLVKIERIQDQNNVLTGGYTKTSRKCPPFCIQPLQVAPGVTTVGELELLEFIDKKLDVDRGVMIDARTSSWHKKGTIPGSINIPFNKFDPKNSEEELAKVLGQLNIHKKSNTGNSVWNRIQSLLGNETAVNSSWDFSDAKEVLLWCNGIWCGQSPRAIKNLLALGYPPNKIYYYRGGMQSWRSLGLTVITPK